MPPPQDLAPNKIVFRLVFRPKLAQTDQGFKFESAKTLRIEQRYMERKVREAVELRRHRSLGTTVVNRDSGSYLKTNQWDVLLARI